MTSEVAYDRRFELLDLDSLCSNVSMASNCYRSQDVSSCFLLLPLLKPCQDGTLTSRASLGSKQEGNGPKDERAIRAMEGYQKYQFNGR